MIRITKAGRGCSSVVLSVDGMQELASVPSWTHMPTLIRRASVSGALKCMCREQELIFSFAIHNSRTSCDYVLVGIHIVAATTGLGLYFYTVGVQVHTCILQSED